MSGATRGPGRAAERLRRLLAVVPYVVRHPGVTIAEVAELFGVGEAELASDLQLLFLSGLPPYGPGDLIDVDIDSAGRITIGMADYFSRPVRLTAPEALALYLRGKALLGAPGLAEAPALAAALEKLERTLGPETLAGLAGRVGVGAGRPAASLALLREAASAHRRLRIEYYTAARDELTAREIDPEHVFSALGNWYVVAWDHLADAERMFRADRIRTAEETGERFEPRGLMGAGRPLYTRSDRDVHVRLRLSPAARWVAEYYETEGVHERRDGTLEVVMPTKDLAWVAKLVLRLAGEATVLAPRELGELVRREAADALAGYRRGRDRGALT